MIEIIDFQEAYRDDFYNINHQWISSMFVVEDIDEHVLRNPIDTLIAPGGRIWFARHPKLGIIGTCALRKTGTGQFELTKMGVLEKARGLKAGKALLLHVINYVKLEKIPLCYLLTSSKCETAIALYLKCGFVHDDEIKKRFSYEYERCDVAMRLPSNFESASN